jgi:hypothetical protein
MMNVKLPAGRNVDREIGVAIRVVLLILRAMIVRNQAKIKKQ